MKKKERKKKKGQDGERKKRRKKKETDISSIHMLFIIDPIKLYKKKTIMVKLSRRHFSC